MKRRTICLSCAITFVGMLLFGAVRAGAAVARSGQVVMGTVLTVTVIAERRENAEAMSQAAIDEARRWDDALTIWHENGELNRLNHRAGRGPLTVSETLRRSLESMLDLSAQTGGAFEPAIGSLWIKPVHAVFPVRGVGRVLKLDGRDATLEAKSALDPGAIGKGLALDAITALLRKGGATAAFLDFGGSSQTAFGASPSDASGWPVLIAGLAREESYGTVHLRDASLSTSRAGAEDTTPILDPRTGARVPGPRLATVLTRNAAAADAWSTALVVTGREGMTAAKSHDIEAILADGEGVSRTPGFPTGPAAAR